MTSCNQAKLNGKELDKFGLLVPLNQLTLAFKTLIWKESAGVRLGGGILLFGPPNCGGDHLLDAVLGQTDRVLKQRLDWRSLIPNPQPSFIKDAFKKAKDNKRAVIIIDEFDELLLQPKIREEVMAELHHLITLCMDNVFIVAYAKEPWKIGDRCVSLFQHKIHVPGPTLESRTALLKVFLEEVATVNELKRFQAISDAEMKSIAELSSLENASWLDLKQCAYEAFQNAGRSHLGLSSGQNVDVIKLTASDSSSFKSTLVISSEHLKAAALQMKIRNSSAKEVEQLKDFMKHWSVMEYFQVVEDDGKYTDYNDKGRRASCFEIFIELLEPWL